MSTRAKMSSIPRPDQYLADEKSMHSSHDGEQESRHEPSLSTVQLVASKGADKNTNDQPTSRYARLFKAETLKPEFFKEIVSAVADESRETGPGESEHIGRPWKTTLLRFTPLSGICAMFMAIGSIVAALGVLAGSDHQPVSQWPVPPSTYLAIFTAIANLSVRYAAFQGAIIAWWFRAYRGSTLGEMHFNWRSGTSFRGAVAAGRHMGLLGLACIFSTLVVVDGPLLQRASTVISVTSADDSTILDVRMAPEIPTDWTGAWVKNASLGPSNEPFNKTLPTNNGPQPNDVWASTNTILENDVVGKWYWSSPIDGVVKGCPKNCKANITAPALVPTTCTSQITPLFYNHTINETSVYNGLTAPSMNQYAVLSSLSLLVEGSHETLNLITQYGTSSNCEGTLNLTICTLESGIGMYEVSIRNNQILLDSLQKPTILSLANNAVINRTSDGSIGSHLSTLGGISSQISLRWDMAIAYFQNPGESIASIVYGNDLPFTYVKPEDLECPSFSDPLDDVLDSSNKLMVYVGALAAQRDSAWLQRRLDPGLKVDTTVTGFIVETDNVFHVDYWFFFAAAIIEVVCVALIVPTYWGWWQIGRSVSFSPLELAKAFEAPLLEDCNSNATGLDLAKLRRDTRVKYGLVTGKNTKLALRDAAVISKPQKDMRFND